MTVVPHRVLLTLSPPIVPVIITWYHPASSVDSMTRFKQALVSPASTLVTLGTGRRNHW